MLEEFLRFVKDNNLISDDDKVLLAVSGGIDSMVMSHLFIKAGIKAGIAHCNFRLRADESDKDEEMVQNFANNHNMPFYVERFDTKEYARRNRLSVQMAARELRYKWFEEIRSENNFNSVAVAHNLNDNIETLLINLTRGTGIAGLVGMKCHSMNIIRPLLFATRQRIVDFSIENNVTFREDKSNDDTKYVRNKIRRFVIPVLKEINPSAETTLNSTARKLGEIQDILSDLVNDIRQRVMVKKGITVIFNISRLRSENPNDTIMFELFRPFGITEAIIKDLHRIINGRTGSEVITKTHRIIKNRGDLIVLPVSTGSRKQYIIEDLSSFKEVPEILFAGYKKITDRFKISHNPAEAFIDAEKLTFPLVIRKWQAGDFFYPLGMTKKKKISDFLIDEKYTLADKENIMVLVSCDAIVWIIGNRLDNRFRITERTRKALVIKTYY